MTTVTIHFHGYAAMEVDDEDDVDAAIEDFIEELESITSALDIDLTEID